MNIIEFFNGLITFYKYKMIIFLYKMRQVIYEKTMI